MFPVASLNTAMRDAFFKNFRKTAMCNLFINRTGGNTLKNNTNTGGLSFLIFISQVSQKQTQISDLQPKHN